MWGSSCTHVKEIPGTRFLVSLQQSPETSANLAIYDISKKGRAKKIYSFEETYGCNFISHLDSKFSVFSHIPLAKLSLFISRHNTWIYSLTLPFYQVIGNGDVTYNPRRGILAAMSISKRTAYHLFKVNECPSKSDGIARLWRKATWNYNRPPFVGELRVFNRLFFF